MRELRIIRGLGRAGALGALVVLGGCAGGSTAERAPAPRPTEPIRAYVANESSDIISVVEYVPGGEAREVEEVEVGIMPGDIDGPHGLTVSPDGRFWYVSMAHGTPYGNVYKYDTETGRTLGHATLGYFPATMGITPDGRFLFVVNFNLHGDPVPSSVSVVYTPDMVEVERIPTCVMPHGSRISASGAKQYSVCMHSDQLVEIDTRTLEVTQRFGLTPGMEGPLALDDTIGQGHAMHAAMGHGDMAMETCGPTWAAPGEGARADRYVYVACNKHQEVLELDTRNWRITRRFATGKAPYNLDVTPDGRKLVATLKGEQAVAVIDLESGREIVRIPTTQPVTHGVAIDPSGRYAFITNEAVGSTLGTVDVIDLVRMERVASTAVQHQPGGIDIWPAVE